MNETYPYTVMPLPYSYYSLEPFLDSQTLYLHHEKHYKAYVDDLNSILAPYQSLKDMTLESLLLNLESISPHLRYDIKKSAGGVYNHQQYFLSMSPNGFCLPKEPLLSKIKEDFSSFDSFLKQFLDQSMDLYGSGYTWLLLRGNKLKIASSHNQNTPLAHDTKPLLCIDLWEHAYYLQYQNKKEDYINNWFSLINWDYALDIFSQKKES